MTHTQLFTSESVTSGHPDKVCDQIADAILDDVLRQDPDAHSAVEVLATTNRVVVAGEISGRFTIDPEQIVRDTVAMIGYDDPSEGFAADTLSVNVAIDEQSPDINQSVRRSIEHREHASTDDISAQGAGDQGLMFGYACTDTPELMPMPIALAHRLARRLEDARRGPVPYLRPDGKTQVSVAYDNGRARGIDTVVVSSQHVDGIELDRLRHDIDTHVIRPVLDDIASELDADTDHVTSLINPSGRFVIGGPAGDTGVTGRKIIVDTYGGFARHGGGAFSGKDASKVDRAGAYATRWIAKNVVAAGLATRCEIQVAYAIGRAEPVGLWVNTFGTAQTSEHRLSDKQVADAITRVFDLRPRAIIDALDLRTPCFMPTASYGHFGRDGFTWEDTSRAADLVDALR